MRRSVRAASEWQPRPDGVLNDVINKGVAEGLGIGQSVCRYLMSLPSAARQRKHSRHSCASWYPVTVHVAIGTDIIHMHPAASGAALGEGSLSDFRHFVANVARLENGVYLNCGSAVVLPEVFLKAIALARNRGVAFSNLTTVNLDFMRMYRPLTNVVARPDGDFRQGVFARGPSRDHDSATGRGAHRTRATVERQPHKSALVQARSSRPIQPVSISEEVSVRAEHFRPQGDK